MREPSPSFTFPDRKKKLGTLKAKATAPAGGGVVWLARNPKLVNLIDELAAKGAFPVSMEDDSVKYWHTYERVFFPAILEEVKAVILKQIGTPENQNWVFHGIWAWVDLCAKKGRDPRTCPPRLRDASVGEDRQQQKGDAVELVGVVDKVPNTAGSFNLHHDWTNPGVPEIYERVLGDTTGARIFNFWIALSDVITAPLGFVGGGYEKVMRPTPEQMGHGVTFVDMEKGDILIFDTLKKIHGALPIVMTDPGTRPENLRRSMEFRVIFSPLEVELDE